jgi:hypothetical protein
VPYIDVELRPAAAVIALAFVLIAVIRAVERHAHTAAAQRTRRAIEQASREQAGDSAHSTTPPPPALASETACELGDR